MKPPKQINVVILRFKWLEAAVKLKHLVFSSEIISESLHRNLKQLLRSALENLIINDGRNMFASCWILLKSKSPGQPESKPCRHLPYLLVIKYNILLKMFFYETSHFLSEYVSGK